MGYGQEFNGSAIYKTSIKTKWEVSEKQKASLKAREIQNILRQKTNILSFDRQNALYKGEEVLDGNSKQIRGANVYVSENDRDVLYVDLANKNYTRKTELMGKIFLISDSLPEFKWTLTNESKNIGVYTCYKSTSIRTEIQPTIVKNGDKRQIEQKEVSLITTAWYAPKIPVGMGPDGYAGLPGLILEISEGNKIILCTAVTLNTKQKLKITAPKGGKVIQQDAYNQIRVQKELEQTKYKLKKKYSK